MPYCLYDTVQGQYKGPDKRATRTTCVDGIRIRIYKGRIPNLRGRTWM